MNIAHIYPSVLRMHGATKWLLLFTSTLGKIGHSNTIFCPVFCIEKPHWFQGEVQSFKIRCKQKELGGISKLISIFFQLLLVSLLPFKIPRNTDVIVLHSELSLFALPLTRLLFGGKRKILYYCYQPPRELYDLKKVTRKVFGIWYLLLGPLFSIYKIVDKVLVRSADSVLVWSNYAQTFAKAIYGDLQLYNVPAGVDFSAFRTMDSTTASTIQLRNNLGLEKQNILLMNSALIVKKNIPSFFKLIQQLVDLGYPVFGLVIGEGPERENLQKMLHTMNLSTHIKLLGYVTQEDLPNYYHMSDIIFYFEQDGIWTMSTIEAGAACKPVIVSSGGSMATLVVQGVTGFVVDTDTFDQQVLKTTCSLLDEPHKRIKMGKKNYIHSKQFSAKSSAQAFMDIIQ